MSNTPLPRTQAGRMSHILDHHARTVLRRGGLVLLATGLISGLGVYFGHVWFHYTLLPALGVSHQLGDTLGGVFIILVAYIAQRMVSLALFRDTELGSTLAARQLEQANCGLQKDLGDLDLLASTDKLTGVWNRRWFEAIVPSEIDRLVRYDQPLSLLVLDVDFFKSVNDRYGHDAGDQVLIGLASQLRATLRRSDSLTRWGGEEFVVLCPNTPLATASLLAGRLRERIANADFPAVGRITVSLGVAECLPDETREQWFQRADAALYQAKANGRNRVEVAPETPPHGSAGGKAAARFLQLVWRRAYESGNETIDREHQALFDHANDLLGAMLSGCPGDKTGDMIAALIREIAEHFQHEEAIVAAAGYPGAAAHAELHRDLNAKAISLAGQFRDGMLEAGELFQFLAHDVVARHMLGADREFFPYLEGK